MLKKILLILTLAIAVFAVVAYLQPNEFKVTRSITINSNAGNIFKLVNDQHQWDKWSPWPALDPNAKFSFDGPEAGVGAVSKWNGNSKLGEGSSTIVESTPNKDIKFKLDFVRPFKHNADAEFSFVENKDGTLVSWSISGNKNFIQKAMGLVLNCDKMIGSQFDAGLNKLKTVAEKK